DLPEAESELIAGFHTEYSGMAWALFYLAEYANAFAVSAMTAILFWGGWLGPILPPWLWLFIKACVGFFIIIWVRGAWPRIRYDQMMRIAWKFALPLSLLLVLVTAAEVLWRRGLA
ncbi:MAG: NADH-quinone oxidoreductase subunit, partial [Chloroflexota bacterium]|nr:NADH-quinone oxidoreductase subunit [Chloroflexota bacterium]